MTARQENPQPIQEEDFATLLDEYPQDPYELMEENRLGEAAYTRDSTGKPYIHTAVGSRHARVLLGEVRLRQAFSAEGEDEKRTLFRQAYTDLSSLVGPSDNPEDQYFRHNQLHQIAKRQVDIANNPKEKLVWLHREHDHAQAIVDLPTSHKRLITFQADFSYYAGLAAEKIAILEEPAKQRQWLEIARDNFAHSGEINRALAIDATTPEEARVFMQQANHSYAIATRVAVRVINQSIDPEETYTASQIAYDLLHTSALVAYEIGNFNHSAHAYNFAADVALQLTNNPSVNQQDKLVWYEQAYASRLRSAEIEIERENVNRAASILGLVGRDARQVAEAVEGEKKYEWLERAYDAKIASAELYSRAGLQDDAKRSLKMAAQNARELGRMRPDKRTQWRWRNSQLQKRIGK